jgi:predicted dehydrogenase
MSKHSISRRSFVSNAAIALTGVAALSLPLIGEAAAGEDRAIRIGLIGTGMRGTGLATLLKTIPGAEIVACCDIIPDHLKDGLALSANGAKAYTDYRKLLDDKSIEAVIIATPHYLHAPMALDALEAGKHIYLEKSLAYDVPQTLELVKKVTASRQVFQVGYQYRYYNLYHKVKEIIGQNWLGKITHFESQYNRNSNWRVPVSDPALEQTLNWRMYRQYCGGPLSELCAHQIDMVNYLLDAHPEKAVGMGGINYWKDGRDTYDNVHVLYEYPGGIKSAVFSVLSNAFNGYSIRVFGDKATVEIQREKAFIYAESFDHAKGVVDGVTGATLEAISQGKPVELKVSSEGVVTEEPTITSLKDFLVCIQTGKKPVSNVLTARDSSFAILMGNAAMDTSSLQIWKKEYSD